MLNNKKQKGFTLLYAVLVSSIVLSASLSIINIALKQHKLSALSRESKIAFYAANTGIDCALYWDGHTRTVTLDPTGTAELDIFTNSSTIYDDPTLTSDDDVVLVDRLDPDDATNVVNCLGYDITRADEFYGTDGSEIEMTYTFPSDTADSSNPKWFAHGVLSDSVDQEDFCLDDGTFDEQDFRTWVFQMILPNSDGSAPPSQDNACAVVSVCKRVNGSSGYSTVYTAKGYNTCDISKENVVERGVRLISS